MAFIGIMNIVWIVSLFSSKVQIHINQSNEGNPPNKLSGILILLRGIYEIVELVAHSGRTLERKRGEIVQAQCMHEL